MSRGVLLLTAFLLSAGSVLGAQPTPELHGVSGAAAYPRPSAATGERTQDRLAKLLEKYFPERLKTLLGPSLGSLDLGRAPAKRDEAWAIARALRGEDSFRAGYVLAGCMPDLVKDKAASALTEILSLSKTAVSPASQNALRLLYWAIQNTAHVKGLPEGDDVDGTYKAGFFSRH